MKRIPHPYSNQRNSHADVGMCIYCMVKLSFDFMEKKLFQHFPSHKEYEKGYAKSKKQYTLLYFPVSIKHHVYPYQK